MVGRSGTPEVDRGILSTLRRRIVGGGRLRMSRLFLALLAGTATSLALSPAAGAETPSTMTSNPPPTAVVANGYLHLFQASIQNAVFRVTAGTLPPGITLQTTGVLTGAPTSGGSFGPTTVCGVNDTSSPACQTFTINVSKRWPAILAAPSSGGVVGTPVSETASLVGAVARTGSVTFRLFTGSACTSEVFRSTNTVTLAAATSTGFTPSAAGTYRWTTSYSGDGNNEPASTPCDPSNSVVLTPGSAPQPSSGGLYHALPPARILDTAALLRSPQAARLRRPSPASAVSPPPGCRLSRSTSPSRSRRRPAS